MKDGYIETCIINQNTVNIITLNGYQMFAKILVEEMTTLLLCAVEKETGFQTRNFHNRTRKP